LWNRRLAVTGQAINCRFTDRVKSARSLAVLPIHGRLLPVLKAYWMACGDKRGFLFTNKSGTQLAKAQTLREDYYRALAAHGLPRTRFHALRTTFERVLSEGGADERTVMLLMRHSSLAMTTHYDTQDVVAMVENMWRISL
jgi:integrase